MTILTLVVIMWLIIVYQFALCTVSKGERNMQLQYNTIKNTVYVLTGESEFCVITSS